MRVSSLAKAAGINPQTVRYYERLGLLEEPPRLPSGYRDYGADALKRLRFIAEAKQIGFTLNQIAQLLGSQSDSPPSCCEVEQIVTERLDDVEAKLRSLRDFRKTLRRLKAGCEDSSPGAPCHILAILEAS